MKFLVLILLLVIGVTLAFRGNQNRGTILGSGSSQSSSQLNIGLIAPHTSFGEFFKSPKTLIKCTVVKFSAI